MRWRKVPTGGKSGPTFDDVFSQAIVELVRSEIPLTAGIRRSIAEDLELLYFPTHPRKIARNICRRQGEYWADQLWITGTAGEKGISREEAAQLLAERREVKHRASRKGLERGAKDKYEPFKKDLERGARDRRIIESLMREDDVSEREARVRLAAGRKKMEKRFKKAGPAKK
jgi:hypothetical protein